MLLINYKNFFIYLSPSLKNFDFIDNKKNYVKMNLTIYINVIFQYHF